MVELLATVNSKDGIPSRITHERWAHIVENHDYMAGNIDKVIETLEDPGYIVSGRKGEKIALKHYQQTSISEKYVVAVYREEEEDGFLITAFMTSDEKKILQRGIIWQKQK